ncbi:MAG: tautomerase family protein [Pseudomonadota bacterium]|nr:tautomerase family protein [Pseudomonadota bacterium]
MPNRYRVRDEMVFDCIACTGPQLQDGRVRRPRNWGSTRHHARGAQMPVIQIHLMEGRTTDQKQALMRAVTNAAAESLGVPSQTVRILLQ